MYFLKTAIVSSLALLSAVSAVRSSLLYYNIQHLTYTFQQVVVTVTNTVTIITVTATYTPPTTSTLTTYTTVTGLPAPPISTLSTSTRTITVTHTGRPGSPTPTPVACPIVEWGQCGGEGYTGSCKTCASNGVCKYKDGEYSFFVTHVVYISVPLTNLCFLVVWYSYCSLLPKIAQAVVTVYNG